MSHNNNTFYLNAIFKKLKDAFPKNLKANYIQRPVTLNNDANSGQLHESEQNTIQDIKCQETVTQTPDFDSKFVGGGFGLFVFLCLLTFLKNFLSGQRGNQQVFLDRVRRSAGAGGRWTRLRTLKIQSHSGESQG